MKEILSVFLIIAILNLIGCHYYQVEKEDIEHRLEKLDIRVVTQDSKVYYFDAGKYFVENDTIKGLCRKWIDYDYEYEKVHIPLEEIEEYEVESEAEFPIFLVIMGIFSVIVFLVVVNSDSENHDHGI